MIPVFVWLTSLNRIIFKFIHVAANGIIAFFFMEYSVQFSHSIVSDPLRPHGLQHAGLPFPSPTPGAYSNLRPLRW